MAVASTIGPEGKGKGKGTGKLLKAQEKSAPP